MIYKFLNKAVLARVQLRNYLSDDVALYVDISAQTTEWLSACECLEPWAQLD